MKKVLLGTSAIALAGAFANTANAVEWNVRVGGYMEQFAAYASSDVDGLSGDWDGIDNKSDTEVHFLPSITLDNGMRIGADVQLEGNSDGDQIDESFLFVDGAFGRVLMGSENSAGYLMHYGAPTVAFITNNHSSGGLNNFVPFLGDAGPANIVGAGTVTGTLPGGGTQTLNVGDDAFRGTLYSVYLENGAGANNDAQRFTYFTPRFAGFQLGVSYARDPMQDNNAQANLDDPLQAQALNNLFDVGANYVNTLGPLDLAVSGRWGIASDDRATAAGTDVGNNPQVWGAGLNVGFGGITVGGSFAEQNNAGVSDGQSWDAGVAYETGPWGFSFSHLRGENVDNENNLGLITGVPGAVTGADEELHNYVLAARYTLAQGVALNAFGAYVDFDEERGDPAGPNAATGDDVDGWVVGTGIRVSW